MKKKNINYILIFSLIFAVLLGCQNSRSSTIQYGDELTRDTFRICIDCMSFSSKFSSKPSEHEYNVGVFLEALAQDIKSACGIEKLAFEVVPQDGAERKTAIQRLRTEVMAGNGPDMFIMYCPVGSYELGYSDALFNFPESNMEGGLFLPLDEYMSNNTQFTDWSNQTKAIMDAGRSDEGQVIIPMTYSLPILIYPESEVDPDISNMTMREIIEDPETEELGAVLYSRQREMDASGTRSIRNTLHYWLGQYADYETEELLFTEEDLYDLLVSVNTLHEKLDENPHQYIETSTGYDLVQQINLAYFDTEMTLVPTYNIDGGITATIQSYTAVNRNTKFPEEAFSVIDYIMQEDMQRKSELYNSYLSGFPLQNDLGQEGKSLCAMLFTEAEKVLPQAYFEKLLKIKGQITAVNFRGEFDYLLMCLGREAYTNGTVSQEAVSKAYEEMKRMIGE